MLNLNPSELDNPVVFEVAGHAYRLDDEGVPQLRPNDKERWQILAADSVAEAEVMGLIVAAFADHLLHFPLGAQEQEQRDVPCPFGRVAAWYLKNESADRTSIHAHGGACQPDLQPDVLAQLLRSPATAARIFTFVEQLSQVDVAGVEPMTSVTPMTMKKRQDVVTDGGYADVIVGNAPATEDHFFLVPKVVE